MDAHPLADPAFDVIAHDGIADLLRDGDPEATHLFGLVATARHREDVPAM